MQQSSKQPIILFGAGGQARVVLDIIDRQNLYTVSSICDLEAKAISWCHIAVKTIENLDNSCQRGIIAIGENSIRQQLAQAILKRWPGFKFINAIHPQSIIGQGVELAQGITVMANAVINSGCKIEDHVVINTSATVEHDCHLESFCTLAPSSTIGGGVRVGQGSYIGMGSNTLQLVKIGAHSIIAAGACVTGDVEEQSLMMGVPAKLKRKLKDGEKVF